MILPLLKLIGWDVRDDSLWNEYVLSNGQVDLACLIEHRVVVAIECKNLGLQLRDETFVGQACCYGIVAGARYAILTDGLIWHIYGMHKAGFPKEKLVRKIDLRKCTIDDAIDFFGSWSKHRALSSDLRIPKAHTGKPKKRKCRRATLTSRTFSSNIAVVERSLGSPLRPIENARNTFETPSGERIRFCLSAGDRPMFTIGKEHLDDGRLFLTHEGYEHGWLVPAEKLNAYFSHAAPPTEVASKKTWTPRVSSSADGDFLWTNRGAMKPLSLTPHRIPVGLAQARFGSPSPSGELWSRIGNPAANTIGAIGTQYECEDRAS